MTGEIGVQLAVSGCLVLAMTIIHGLGLLGTSKILHLNKNRLEEHDLDIGALILMGFVGVSVFALHMLEIWLFAAFYLAVGAISSLEEALYYSASAYATLGRPAAYFA